MKTNITILILLFAGRAFSAEADYFSQRRGLPDLENHLDEKANSTLVSAANRVKGCDGPRLHFEIFQNVFMMRAEEWAEKKSATADKRALRSTVYSGLSAESGNFPGLDLSCCGEIFRIGSHIVSSDKLSHFFHSGFEMQFFAEMKHGSAFPRTPLVREAGRRAKDPSARSSSLLPDSDFADHYRGTLTTVARMTGITRPAQTTKANADEREDLAIKLSHAQEDGTWGLRGPGVKSYGDIAANVEGYKFWGSLINGPNPYFRCEDGKWKQVRQFKFADYASDAWDEGINCSDFRTENFRNTMKARVDSLASEDKAVSHQCPVEPQKCVALVARYGAKASQLLHPECLKAGTQSPRLQIALPRPPADGRN